MLQPLEEYVPLWTLELLQNSNADKMSLGGCWQKCSQGEVTMEKNASHSVNWSDVVSSMLEDSF